MICTALLFLLCLSGCTQDTISSAVKTLLSFKASDVWLESVSFKVSHRVNDSSPVAVHIVIPYTTDLYKKLGDMSAHDYFKNAHQLQRDNKDKIDVFEFELVRDQELNDEPIRPHDVDGQGVLVFASYTTPGTHRLSIGASEHVLISLDDTDFTISQKNSG